jgi:cell division septum initiation protein DivIVA
MTHSPSATQQVQPAVMKARDVQFQTSKYGRGYERRMVDEFVSWTAQTFDSMQEEFDALQAEITRLRQRVIDGPHEEDVVQAVHIISNAQRTADGIIAEADAYSARVMSEARAAYDDASRRGAKVEQDAEENVRRLTLQSQVHQDELDKQTAYLRTLRDATRTQMEKFLAAMLDHVASEFGRAHPIAAGASGAESLSSPDGTDAAADATESAQPSSATSSPQSAPSPVLNGTKPVIERPNGAHPVAS